IVWPDELMMIFAPDVLSRQPGADIVFDVKSTRRLNALIGNYGGRPVIWKTGHSFMREKVRELDAPLGGEYSGHIFFNDRWYGFDDGMYAAARLVEIISLREQSLDDIFDTLPSAEASPEYRVQVAEQEKFALVESLADSDAFGDCKLITVDGVRIEDGDSWGLVRASNTSAEITLRFEGSDEESMQSMAERIKNELLSIRPDLSLDF
ncbi:MAG: phosphomannomutase/phosphoglucomutase, partial [Porticoccaceae bacterium]|nr:phosphomannomutase/phosphoglucomutase [Porticoccaceae bacterium]